MRIIPDFGLSSSSTIEFIARDDPPIISAVPFLYPTLADVGWCVDGFDVRTKCPWSSNWPPVDKACAIQRRRVAGCCLPCSTSMAVLFMRVSPNSTIHILSPCTKCYLMGLLSVNIGGTQQSVRLVECLWSRKRTTNPNRWDTGNAWLVLFSSILWRGKIYFLNPCVQVALIIEC